MKNKENSTLNYTLSSSSFPFFWVVKAEATLLFSYCLFITVKINWVESQKKLQVEFSKEKPKSLSHVATWVLFICSSSVVTKFSLVATSFLAASLTSGCDLNFGCDLFVSVVLKN